MRIDPRHLRIVLAIAQHGTFNRAAASLNMSQPALSKSISLLERALGVKLFDRGKQGTSLTEIPIFKENLFVAVPSNHRLHQAKKLRIADLVEEAWILPSSGSSFHRIVEALFVAANKQLPENTIITNSLQMQEQLVQSTGRLCLMTPVQFLGRKPPFRLVPLQDAPNRVIGIRHLRKNQISMLAQEFINAVNACQKI